MNEHFVNQIEVGIKEYKPLKDQKTILAKKIPDIDLQKIKIPVLILIGSRSVIFDPHKTIKKAKAIFSCIKTELIPECCHAINMEQSEIVDSIMIDFLK